MKGGDVAGARRCYERAVEELGDDANSVGGVVGGMGFGGPGAARAGALRARPPAHAPAHPPTHAPAPRQEELFLAFAEFEVKCREVERAR